MGECYRCKDWQRMGLSDTCPSCDLPHKGPPMTSLRERLEEYARQTIDSCHPETVYANDAMDMLELLWPCVNFLGKAGQTHTPPEDVNAEFQAGYQQALDDIKEWAGVPLAALEKELGDE